MTLLSSYLSKERVKKVLSLKPGQEGFSLIELVVVVAVLAVLSAIAIPNFQSMTQKARAAAASNTVATLAKECAVKYANGEASPTFAAVSLDGYRTSGLKSGEVGGDAFTWKDGTTPSATACVKGSGKIIRATSDSISTYPTFEYNVYSGAKTCKVDGGMSAADQKKVGCVGGIW